VRRVADIRELHVVHVFSHGVHHLAQIHAAISLQLITGANLALTQTGTTFSGSYSNAKLTCEVAGVQSVIGTYSGQVVNGLLSGDSVSFDFDTGAFTNTGTIAGSSMSGTATATKNVGGTIGNVMLTGQWGATKG
jgi:hypothetical protein